jgi:cytochrome c oxidase subunit 2
VNGVLQPAGPVAAEVAALAWLLIVGATLVFGIVMALLWRALAARGVPAERHLLRRWIMAGGLVFPGVVLGALLAHASWRSRDLALPRAPHNEVISVVARSWWWQVRYRHPHGGPDVLLANEIHIPVGRPVTLGLASADVIHSLWIPALAGKVDMVPGRTHRLRLQADRPGVYRGQCAEFCGTQHARMALHVVAHEPADYARWLAAQARPAALPTDALAARGLEQFRQLQCPACHDVRGLASGLALGPDLTHVGSRLRLGAGSVANDRDTLAQWVAHSDAAKPGVRMPSYAHLDAAALQALAAFLDQLE